MLEDSDEFGWHDESDDEEIAKVLGSSSQATESFYSQPIFYPDLPSKAPRTPQTASPGKRKLEHSSYSFDQTVFSDTSPTPSPSRSRSGFGSESTAAFALATPTSTRASQSTFQSRSQSQSQSSILRTYPPSSAELCMTPTPVRNRDALSLDTRPDESELSKSACSILEKHGVVLPNNAYDELVELLNRHDLKMRGVNRARDILRVAMKKKDEEITRLKERNTNLLAQNEMDRSIIDRMRRRERG
ncbi:hypothetical protein POX_g08658 [Penicillium oxalicum]|uniref:hypothetical protein n=1 Tax=Penicillium oxalicum TaxID=69781 RepID=UPI0020B7CFE5|nr:hypothetical protein POX_g08658 [Penicillium oxalicum]KAI2786275.1 hypothetical protein POX_g08658 [Penicillium oxalicum]